MSIWILVAILFVGGQMEGRKMFVAQTEQECKEARAEIQAQVKAANLTVWISECQEVSVPKFQKDRDS